MALDKQKLKTQLKEDLDNSIGESLAQVKDSLTEELKGSEGGFHSAMINIKDKVQAFNDEGGHSALDFMPFIQRTVSEEYAKAISTKLVKSLSEDWAPKVAEAIANSVSERIDEYFKNADIVVPAGSKVLVPLAGPSAGNGTVTEDSRPATIN